MGTHPIFESDFDCLTEMSIFQPLAGKRIVDLTRVLAGPFCTQLLGDWGADVIKIEQPGSGDDTRHWGPPFDQEGTAIYFHSINRNKKSLAVDFRAKKGLEVIEKLVAESDVFVENFIPGKLAEYGLGYEDLKSINPKIVYASLSGFGQQSTRAGYDVIVASVGGLMSITGAADGPPARVGVAVTDLFTGSLMSNAILAALSHVEQNNEAVWVQSSLLQSQAAMLSHIGANFLTAGLDGKRYGTAHPSLVPYQSFKTADEQYLTVGAGNNRHFEEICDVLLCPELAADPRFISPGNRVINREPLIKLLSNRFSKKTRNEWEALFEEKKVKFPWGGVNSIAEAFSLPEVADLTLSFDRENGDKITVPGTPVNFDKQLNAPSPVPRLGEHSSSVLSALGYSQAEISEYVKNSII